MPNRADLAIYQGDDYSGVVTVTYTNDPAIPDFTGCTAQAQIREGPADDNPDVVVEIATAIILPNMIAISIPAAQTVNLCGKYSWDLQVSGPSLILTTILTGNANITPEVTRPVVGRRMAVNHA